MLALLEGEERLVAKGSRGSIVKEGEERLVAKGSRGSIVKDSSDGGVLARLVEFGTPFLIHASGWVEGEVDLWRKEIS
jgi:hypothetical protein